MYGGKPIFVWLIEDIYYCGIPMVCRSCYRRNSCRYGWLKGRKCRHGCEKLNIMREQRRQEDREAYIESLVSYFDEEEKRGRIK